MYVLSYWCFAVVQPFPYPFVSVPPNKYYINKNMQGEELNILYQEPI